MLLFIPRSLCALKRVAAKSEHARFGGRNWERKRQLSVSPGCGPHWPPATEAGQPGDFDQSAIGRHTLVARG